jgi:hypothetical protein
MKSNKTVHLDSPDTVFKTGSDQIKLLFKTNTEQVLQKYSQRIWFYSQFARWKRFEKGKQPEKTETHPAYLLHNNLLSHI